MRESASFKLWQQRHDIRTFRTRDDDGNLYEVFCMGGFADKNGVTHDLINAVRQYRPDGTLAAETSNAPDGQPTSWSMLDRSGHRYTCTVHCVLDVDHKPEVRRVVFFGDAGNEREWTIDRGVVRVESTSNPIGEDSRMTHVMRVSPNRSTPTTRNGSR